MSFLSLAFLTALPLAAAPILLHLFDRRRNVVIPWGAMQFLMEAATRRTRARRFQHWLLLALRVLAVAALVLALARPLAQSNWLGGSGRREVVLILDNSLSTGQCRPVSPRPAAGFGETRLHSTTGQQLGDGAAFDELTARAKETINGLEPGNAVRILLTSPYPAWATPASLQIDAHSRESLIELLDGLRPTQGTSDLPAALLKAVQSDLEDQRLVARQVLLLTDGQRTDWRTDNVEAWARYRAAIEETRVPTTLEVIEAGANGSDDNLAVTRLRSNWTVVGVHQPFSVTAEVRNHSAGESKACPLTWLIDRQKQSDSRLPALKPGEKHDVVLKHSFGRTGVYSLACRIDPGDALEADNGESIVVEVVDQVPVLLVEGADDFAEMQQDAYLVRAALGRIEGSDAEDWQAVFEPRAVSPQRLESIELSDYRAVVIPNLAGLSDRSVERLTQFVEEGGGLWLALGPRTDIDDFNKLLFNDGDGPSPVAVARIVDESHDELQKPTINPFPKSHPATADLADNDRLDTGEVKIARRFRFQMPPEASHVSVLLELSNGEPLVVENRLGRGRVIVQGVPLRFQWSDLAVSQAFVVMVHDWLAYLTEPGAMRHNLLPGDPISLEVSGMRETHATLTTPSSEDVAIAGSPLADGLLFRTSRTASPGSYSLEIGLAGSRIPFHVARDASESDLARLTAFDRKFLSSTAGIGSERTAAQIARTTRHAPVWPGLLALLIALIAGELVLSGAIARKRFGSIPISETAEQMAGQASVATGITLGNKGQRPTREKAKATTH